MCEIKAEPGFVHLLQEQRAEGQLGEGALGAAVSHVDDVLHGGHGAFDNQVMEPLKELFKFGDGISLSWDEYNPVPG